MALPCTLVDICKLWLFYISECKDKVNLCIHASHKSSLLTLITWSCEETIKRFLIFTQNNVGPYPFTGN